MNRAEWLEERKKGIGGSDAAAILGRNPYMNNVDLWEIKTGRKEQEDISDKDCVKFGAAAEDPIRLLFMLDYPRFYVVNEPYKTYTNLKHKFIKGSFDGIITDSETGKMGVLEIKTTTIHRWKDWEKWDNKIPDNYFCQVLHYFLVREDFEFAIVKARIVEDYTNSNDTNWISKILKFFRFRKVHIRHYILDRNDYLADLDILQKAEEEFWGYVERDERPPLLLPEI